MEYIRVDSDCHVYYFCRDVSTRVFGGDVSQVGCEIHEIETRGKLARVLTTAREVEMDMNRDAFDTRHCEGICIGWIGREDLVRYYWWELDFRAWVVRVTEHSKGWGKCYSRYCRDENGTVQHDPTSVHFNLFHPQQFDKIVRKN